MKITDHDLFHDKGGPPEDYQPRYTHEVAPEDRLHLYKCQLQRMHQHFEAEEHEEYVFMIESIAKDLMAFSLVEHAAVTLEEPMDHNATMFRHEFNALLCFYVHAHTKFENKNVGEGMAGHLEAWERCAPLWGYQHDPAINEVVTATEAITITLMLRMQVAREYDVLVTSWEPQSVYHEFALWLESSEPDDAVYVVPVHNWRRLRLEWEEIFRNFEEYERRCDGSVQESNSLLINPCDNSEDPEEGEIREYHDEQRDSVEADDNASLSYGVSRMALENTVPRKTPGLPANIETFTAIKDRLTKKAKEQLLEEFGDLTLRFTTRFKVRDNTWAEFNSGRALHNFATVALASKDWSAYIQNPEAMLHRLDNVSMTSIQTITAAALNQGHSIIITSEQDCGQDWAYLIPILDRAHSKRLLIDPGATRSIDIAPMALIFHTSRRIYDQKQMMKALKRESLPVDVAFLQSGRWEHCGQHAGRGAYDVVVANFQEFVSYAHSGAVKFAWDRLEVLVMDQAGHPYTGKQDFDTEWLMDRTNGQIGSKAGKFSFVNYTLPWSGYGHYKYVCEHFVRTPVVVHLEVLFAGKVPSKRIVNTGVKTKQYTSAL